MDLLTVVMHELGHVLDLDSVYGGDPANLMDAFLDTGDRRLPSYPASSTATAPTSPGNAEARSDGWSIPDWWFTAADLRQARRDLTWGTDGEMEFVL